MKSIATAVLSAVSSLEETAERTAVDGCNSDVPLRRPPFSVTWDILADILRCDQDSPMETLVPFRPGKGAHWLRLPNERHAAGCTLRVSSAFGVVYGSPRARSPAPGRRGWLSCGRFCSGRFRTQKSTCVHFCRGGLGSRSTRCADESQSSCSYSGSARRGGTMSKLARSWVLQYSTRLRHARKESSLQREIPW